MERDERWALRWEQLAEFRHQHGHVDVPRGYRTATGAGLGAWVHRQRTLHARGTLPTKRGAQLEELGIRWAINDRTRAIDEYAAFVAEHGHGLVPSAMITESGFPLGTWVQSRRRQYQLDPGRARRLWPELVAGGFVWQIRNLERQWEEGLQELTKYRAAHGDCLVPANWVTAGRFQLGRWVDTRRTEFRAGTLNSSRIDALDAIGMVWWLREVTDVSAREARELAHFRRCCRAFAAYVAESGTSYVPTRYITDQGLHLGRWLLRQRLQYRQGALAEDRVDMLNSIAPSWDSLPNPRLVSGPVSRRRQHDGDTRPGQSR